MAQTGSGDGLWRWLVGGLVAGGVLLGLLIAAYAVGYHRGEHRGKPASPAAAATQPAATEPAATEPATTAAAPTTSPAAAVARGKELYTSDACVGCHSLDGIDLLGADLQGPRRLAGRSSPTARP